MKRLYTEEQFEIYSNYLNEIENEEDVLRKVEFYLTLKDFLTSEELTDEATEQMDERIMSERLGK